MSAFETFEWYVRNLQEGKADPRVSQYVQQQRLALLTLRSEDERQRFVDALIGELRSIQSERQKT